MTATYPSQHSQSLYQSAFSPHNTSLSGQMAFAAAVGGSEHRKRSRTEICGAFIENLRRKQTLDLTPPVVESIQKHFEQLPTRYALNVNIDTVDVLNHKRLLDSARADPSAVSFQVRPVDVLSVAGNKAARNMKPSFGSSEALLEAAVSALHPKSINRPAFGSSPSLEALAQDVEEGHISSSQFYEVTIASVDQQRLLSRLSEAIGDLNLNIVEAHAFNTKDHFSLDVFVVNEWKGEDTQELEDVLSERLQQLPQPMSRAQSQGTPMAPKHSQEDVFDLENDDHSSPALNAQARMAGEASVSDDWELDPSEIDFQEKIASGAFGDLYKGIYCGQDVAIKILRNVQDDTQQYQEFLQEVAIMRKVRHRNVVQFIGACTRKPNLCIVVEFMPCGSMFDHLRKDGPPKLSTLLKAATEICRGMDYLHKRRIIHRDLKAANLLTDDTGVIKIADFGVARIMDGMGVMTAETGTYRWMAPEVIEHQPYGEKADVFSFGVVLWELLTGRVPYQELTPLQAAVGVVQKGLRPPVPQDCPGVLADVMRQCWAKNPKDRPSFETLKVHFENLWQAVRSEEGRQKSLPQGLLSKLSNKFKS